MNTRDRRLGAFTLIELLVVIGIIGVLISILLPSMNAARNSARKVRVQAQLNAAKQALEAIRNELGDYPDSAKRLDPTDDSSYTPPAAVTLNDTILYGAQVLARALVGKDYQGFVSRKRARKFDPGSNPTEYYDYRPCDGGPEYRSVLPRQDKYFNETHSMVRTAAPCAGEAQLLGVRPGTISNANSQLVMIDAFDAPVLYYKANPRGNVLCDATADSNGFADPDNGLGIPYYNLLDNDVFTGTRNDVDPDVTTSMENGWQFGTGNHQIRELGNPLPDPGELHDPSNIPANVSNTFTLYIHDHKAEQAAAGAVRPVNPDSYLLISAGRDGIYGTADDINNFQER